ncbi:MULTISPECIES: sugar-binding transcriptional regulator [Micrococcaceae]|uniref:sugar-binding transcriptional regulator n=1 Tax=Micrococcaceae TaxID=1268 RepID=UPI0005B924C6|nr:sugar-binding domain-containing protein [Arthrobacter sp. 31Y]
MTGPEERLKMAYVARRYYRDDATRSEIADEIGVSRFKIARMLERAKDLGIIKFEISAGDLVDPGLSVDLQKRFGLHRALVVTAPSEGEDIVREFVGRAAAHLLSEIVEEGDVVGFTSGRTVYAVAGFLETLPRCDVVALGGVAGQATEHGVEILRRAQRIAGGKMWPIFAPLVVRDPATARALLQDPLIHQAASQFRRVTKGVVAVGSWNPPNSQLYDAARELGYAEDMLAQGVVGEVAATLFAEDGRIIKTIDDRTIAIRAETLKKIPEVICVAGGASKARAMRAAISAGLVHSVVTDASLARELLALA